MTDVKKIVALYYAYALHCNLYKQHDVKRKERWEMDFANRGNRPTQTPPSMGGQNNEQPTQPVQPVEKKDKPAKDGSKAERVVPVLMLFAVTAILVTLIVGLVFGGADTSGASESDLIQTDKYQAVFLDSQDGQVYFGKLEVYNSHLYRLTDIFYVRVEQPIQPEGANQQQQANISLAKLGNELHGPQDAMYIARNKVLYWENLKDDGQVVTAIKEFDANGRQTQDNPQSQAAPTPAPTENDGAAGTQPTGTDPVDDTPAETPTETPTP